MKTQHKISILLIGPSNSGKTRLANFLCDIPNDLPEEMQPTKALRIVEYDLSNIDIDGCESNVDIQLWDTSGDEIYSSYWPVFRKYTDGVVFVYSPDDNAGMRKLESMCNYFVNQVNLSYRACLVCCLSDSEDSNSKLGSSFMKISHVSVDLENQGDKFKQDFSKYIISVIKTLKE